MSGLAVHSRWVAILSVVLCTGGIPAVADCGSIPFQSPFELFGGISLEGSAGNTDVRFDPMDVVVFEPGQRAIILWNGVEEILFLSTEIKTSEPVSILEVIPFPNEPEVRLGEFETFQKMQRLLIEKTMWRVAAGGGVANANPPKNAVEITFHEKMGAHDVAVVHVLDKAGFLNWVDEFMRSKEAVNATVDPKFAEIIENYLDRGYAWFVFDAIQAADQVQSRQPIEYRFKSDSVYYPLEISSRETGKTNIDLLVLTSNQLTQFPEVKFVVKKDDQVALTSAELLPVRQDWASFMGQESFTMQRIRIKGNIRTMKTDFIAR
jgi:hypothetical protein